MTFDRFIFFFVERSVFTGVQGSAINLTYMNDRYLAMLDISRSAFWANRAPAPTPGVPPGFVLSGTSVALSCAAGDTIRYTLDGTAPDPAASPVYAAAFTVPPTGCLIVHAVATRPNGMASPPASFVYFPRRPLDKPFFGLNVSLIFGSENPGDALSEVATRARLQPVAPLTQWVRTFGTINNGHEHINRIAKAELGLRTLIGLWVSNGGSDNAAQLNGLRAILQRGPAPDLIAVGNECSLSGVPDTVLTNVIAAVRGILAEHGLGASVPVGSADIGGTPWSGAVLNQLDFVGVNIYCGTWDATPEGTMAAATAQLYTNETQRIGNRMLLLTETGTPYAGGTYTPPAGGTQTASAAKASAYLGAMLDWTRDSRIPLFYFSAYDEAWKSRGTGHVIEQYFGLMGVGGVTHAFYAPVIASHQPPVRIDGITVTPPAVNLSWLDGNARCVISGKTNLADAAWVPLAGADVRANGTQLDISGLRFFRRSPPE